MRVKIRACSEKPVFIPFNYQYQLSAAIYKLIAKSSSEYAQFLHDFGFRLTQKQKSVEDGVTIENYIVKTFKFFTFSQLHFSPYRISRDGFKNVQAIEFLFSTPITDSLKHFVFGIFTDQIINLNFYGQNEIFRVANVESLPEPAFSDEQSFLCLSPIAVSTSRTTPSGRREQHFLNYLNPEERLKFQENIQKNLIRKYKTLTGKTIRFSNRFAFNFDSDYIVRRQEQISKLITFKDDIKIKAFMAPFTIKARPELIQTGYTCGFGEKNSDGFGCVEVMKVNARGY